MDKTNSEKICTTTMIMMMVAFFTYSIFSVTIGTPIFASDEYAYFIHGKYIKNIAELYKLDPGLQHAPNLLFFQLINAWVNFTGSGFIYALRIFHAAQYILTAFILYNIFIKIIDRNSAFWGVLAFLLLPNVIYNYAVMPETELVLLASCLSYLLLVVFPRRQYLAATLTGILLGVSILIKPHAIAILSVAFVFLSIAPTIGLIKGGRTTAFNSTLIMLASCYFSIIFLLRLFLQEWSFDPTIALGLSAYGQYIQTSLPTASIASKSIIAIQYGVAHIVVITLFFAPVLVWAVSTILKTIRRDVDKDACMDDSLSLVAFYVMTMLAAHIAMVAWFTAGAGSLNEGEAMRLHGRYLGPVIALFPFIYFYAIQKLNVRGEKALKVITFGAIFLCFLYVFELYKIFPWDYPLLFAFFKSQNHYGWDFQGSFSFMGDILLYAMLGAWVFVIFFNKILKKVLFIQIFVILITGCIQNYAWVLSHTKANSDLSEYSRTISTLLGKNQFGKGLVVSDERYGRASYILFGLGNAPKVIIKQPKTMVTNNDILGASWVLFGNEYVADFDYLESISIGQYRLFLFNTNFSVEHREKPFIKLGQQNRVLMGEGQYSPARLKGFNTQEDWGVWTSASNAKIELPFKMKGVVKLNFFGCTILENLGEPLNIRVGDASSQVVLSDTGKEYEIIMNIRQVSDTIHLDSRVFRPIDSHRVMGVGISRITLELLSP